MRNLNSILDNKKIVYDKLLEYGFIKKENNYSYRHKIIDNQFEVVVEFYDNNYSSYVLDLASEEEYILVDVENVTGEYVGRVKQEYEDILNDIISKCFINNSFKSNQSKLVIKYIKDKYNSDLEFLWEKYDNDAVARNKINDKWFLALLTVKKDRFGDFNDDYVEVIDLRYQKDSIDDLIDNKKIYPGYHMNKKSWITIILDDSVDINYIYELIDNSFDLSVENNSKMTELSKKVYEYLLLIPHGKVVTYKQVAEYLGNKGLARIVGNILHKNPDGDKYPCYKVLNSRGELAEKFVFGGSNIQKERLVKDGIEVIDNKVDLNKYQWK